MKFKALQTKIWRDGFFIDLSPSEKLLYLYLLSNDSVNVIGLYELPLRVVRFETGLTNQQITSGLQRFAQSAKAFFLDDYVWIVKLLQYNKTASPKVQVRIERELESTPDGILKEAHRRFYDDGVLDLDTLSIGYLYPIGININSDSNNHLNNNKTSDKSNKTKPKKPKKNKPKKNTKTQAANVTREIQQTFSALLGYDPDWAAGESVAAKKIGEKWTSDELSFVYKYLKEQKFWADKYLSLRHVAKQMPEVLRKRKGQGDTNDPDDAQLARDLQLRDEVERRRSNR